MKKLILLALVAVIMAGCGEYYQNPSTDYQQCAKSTYIDSCEYIRTSVQGGYTFAHKGNCKFCKERRQKELEELVIRLKEK